MPSGTLQDPSADVKVDADGSRHAIIRELSDSTHSGFIQAASQDRIGLPQSAPGVTPFAPDFFDAIVCVDSICYFGTDDLYLNYLARFVKPGGQVGIAGAGLIREIEGSTPDHLCDWWTHDLWCLHSAAWWRRHWERTGIMDIDVADTMPNGWHVWLDWQRAVAPDNAAEIKALESDRGTCLGYVRLVGHRNGQAKLTDPIVSLPARYTKKPLLRREE